MPRCAYCRCYRKVIAKTYMGWRGLCNWHWLLFAENLKSGIRVYVN